MNETEELCVSEEVGHWSVGFSAFSGVYASVCLVLMAVGLGTWMKLRTKYVYLKKRGLALVVLLTLGWCINLLAGPLPRTTNNDEAFIHLCPIGNISFLMVAPTLVLGTLTRVVTFRNQAYLQKLLGTVDFQLEKEKINRAWFYSSSTFGLLFAFLSFVITLGVAIGLTTTFCPELGAEECVITSATDIEVTSFLFVFVLLAAGVVIYINRTLRHFPDPFNILREVRTGLFIGLITQAPGIVLSGLNLGKPAEQETIYFTYGVLYDIPIALVCIYLIHYQIYKAKKFDEFDALYSIVSLDKVLKDPVGKELLKSHVRNEFSIENINFIEVVDEYRKIKDPVEQMAMATQIYDEFLRHRRLNVGAAEVHHIETSLNEGAKFNTLFDEAYDAIYGLLETDSFPRFQNTPTFLSYVGVGDQKASRRGMTPRTVSLASSK